MAAFRACEEPEYEFAFADFAWSLQPDSTVVIVNSYFDESYDNHILCLAGYSFTSRNARMLDEEWRKMLIRYRHLPYFRMSLCNAKDRGEPFDKLNDTECIDLAIEAIGLINKFASIGYAITIDKKAFNRIITKRGVVSTPYEFCSWLCLTASRSEMHKRCDVTG